MGAVRRRMNCMRVLNMSELVWKPKNPQSRMWEFMNFVSQEQKQEFAHYQELHHWSVRHPELFWKSLCTFFAIQFDHPAEQVLNEYQDMLDARWFSGARFNFAAQLLNRRDNHPAIIEYNEENERTCLSFQQLYQEVAQCAAGLKALGISAGDRVAALMPNTSYTIIAMLATSSLGAIWSSCSPDFGAQAALDRLGQIDPKILFICDGHQYQGKQYDGKDKIKQLDKAIPSLVQIVICPNIYKTPIAIESAKIKYWDEFIKPAMNCEFVSLPFAHPLYILFSSGTTGKPKCIMHGAGGTLLQHMKELGLHTNLSIKDNLCFYTTCGWMMCNWSVSALALGATLTLYEGSPAYPDHRRLFQLIEQEKVTVFGTSAKYISAIEKAR